MKKLVKGFEAEAMFLGLQNPMMYTDPDSMRLRVPQRYLRAEATTQAALSAAVNKRARKNAKRASSQGR